MQLMVLLCCTERVKLVAAVWYGLVVIILTRFEHRHLQMEQASYSFAE